MAQLFLTKFFDGEPRLTLIDLGRERQHPSEELVAYVQRFKDKTFDCAEQIPEEDLVNMCIAGMLQVYRLHLENLGIETYRRLLSAASRTAQSVKAVKGDSDRREKRVPMMAAYEEEKRARYAEPKRKGREDVRDPPPPFKCSMAQVHLILDNWIRDKVIALPPVTKEPSAEDRASPRYCRYHRHLRHPTKECWFLQRMFDRKHKAGELIFPEDNVDVNHRPFPDHGKGPAQVRVMINQDDDFQLTEFLPRPERPDGDIGDDTTLLAANLVNNDKFRRFYDDMGFTPAARLAATKALIDVSIDFGTECFVVNSFTKSKAPMMCFSDKDLDSRVMHNQALYVAATVEGIEVTRALVDGGAGVNVMPLSTFKSLGISEDRVVPSSIRITGIEERPMPTLGYVVVDLVVGPLRMKGRFHITKPDAPFHIVLGRPWIHSHEAVPSTYHRCVKAWQGGREVTIRASTAPFETVEIRKTDTPSFSRAIEEEECMIRVPKGIKLLEDTRPRHRHGPAAGRGETSHQQKDMQGRKRGSASLARYREESSRCKEDKCQRIVLPDGRIAYSVKTHIETSSSPLVYGCEAVHPADCAAISLQMKEYYA